MNKALAQWVAGLHSRNRRERESAAIGLKLMAHQLAQGEITEIGGPAGMDWEMISRQQEQSRGSEVSADELAKQMLELSQSSDDFVASTAKEVLGELGVLPADMLAVLIAGLKAEDHDTRYWAASTLNDMREAAAPAAKELGEALQDPALSVRGQAVSALRHLNAKAAPALYSLMDALTDKESTIRGSAAYILGTLGEVAEPALEPLIQALNDPEPVVSMNAAGALGSLKAAAERAIPALQAAHDAAPPGLKRSYADPLTRIRFHLMP